MISVTFSGEADELIALFSSDGFLEAVRRKVAPSAEPPKPKKVLEVKSAPEPKPAEPPKPAVNRGSMVRAVQEYALRMHGRLSVQGVTDVQALTVCRELLLQATGGVASHTSKVPDEFLDKVYELAVNDVIPDSLGSKLK